MKDILPDEQTYWEYFRHKAAEIAEAYSFGRIDVPRLERRTLCAHLGQGHGCGGEKYVFED